MSCVHRYCLATALLFAVSAPTAAQYYIAKKPRDFRVIDQHALRIPKYLTGSPTTLANSLTQQCHNDKEKVRAIYRWIAHNIQYDKAIIDKKKRNLTAKEVLKTRRCVCGGMANLFKALCDEAGVRAAVVTGYAKKPNDPPGTDYRRNRHAWNAARIDGHWQLLDVTWAAEASARGRRAVGFVDTYFLMKPEQMVFTHFPLQTRWQLLERPLSYKEFAALPNVPGSFFRLGFTVEQVLRETKKGTRHVVKTYALPSGIQVKIREAPVPRRLSVGKPYRFVIEADAVREVVFKHGKRMHKVKRHGNTFRTNFYVPAGELELCVVVPHPTDRRVLRYYTVLSYEGAYPFVTTAP